MSKYLDDTGLLRFWQKLKTTFAGAPADLCAEQGKPIFDGMYIDATTHALVESAGISNRALIFEIEPNTTYVIECPVASTKRAGTFVTNAVNAVATSYETVTGKDSMEITSGPTDAYLVVQVFVNGDNENIALYQRKVRVDKKSDFNAYAKRNDLAGCEEHIPLVVGTQTTKTGSWTGEAPTITELKDGQSIRYWLPAEPTGNATLNLTLADDTETGALPVYFRGTTRMTTHLAVNNCAVFTYREDVQIGSSTYTGWWYNYGYYVDTVSRTRADNLRPVAGDTIIYGRNIVLEDGDGVFRSITRSNSTNTSHTCATQGFKNPAEMFYYSYSSNVAVGATMASNYMFSAYNALDFRYNSNCGTTLIPNHPIYLIFEHKTDGLYYLKTGAWWTQTLPTTDDGYVYVYVGHAYSTNYYNFAPSHPMLCCRNGVIVPYAGEVAMKDDVYTKAEVNALIPESSSIQSKWFSTHRGGETDLFHITELSNQCLCYIYIDFGGALFKTLMLAAPGGNLTVSVIADSSPAYDFSFSTAIAYDDEDDDLSWYKVLRITNNLTSDQAWDVDGFTAYVIPIMGTPPTL